MYSFFVFDSNAHAYSQAKRYTLSTTAALIGGQGLARGHTKWYTIGVNQLSSFGIYILLYGNRLVDHTGTRNEEEGVLLYGYC